MKLKDPNLVDEGQQKIHEQLLTSTDPSKKARDTLNGLSYIEQQEF